MRGLPLFWIVWSMATTCAAQGGLDSMLQALPAQRGEQRAITLGNIAYETGLADPAKAKPFADEAIAIAIGLGDSALVGRSVNDLALIEHRLGHFHRAIELNRRALRIRTVLQDTLGMAASHSKIGAAWVELYQFDSALFHNQAAERVYHALGDRQREAMLRGNSGRLYQQMGDLVKAEAVTREAVAMLQDAPAGYPKANTFGQLAVILQEAYKEEESVPMAEKALELYTQLGMRSEMASMANIIGTVERNRGHREAALRWFTQAQRWSEEGNDVSGQATFLNNMAEVHADAGQPEEAIALLERSVLISETEGYTDQLVTALDNLVPLLEQRGDTRNALRRHKQMVALKDSIYARERITALSDMQVKYETERTEMELARSQEKEAVQRAELDRRRIIQGALIGGLLLLAAVALLFLSRQRARHTARLNAELLAEREKGLKAVLANTDAERKRIAAELHDGVGQQLTGLKYRLEDLSTRLGPLLPAAAPQLKEVLTIADDASRDVRGIAHRMMPRALGELGLAPALDDMLKKALALPGMHCNFEHYGMEERLPPEVEVGVFRIAQELVGNILKHAGAQQVDVQLLRNKGHLVLIVEDDGRGMDGSANAGGLGMLSMADRARVLHGTFTMERAANGGTLATVRVPVPATAITPKP